MSATNRWWASRVIRYAAWAAGVVLVIGALYIGYDSSMHAEDRGPGTGIVTAELLARGEYLTRAADCSACHTTPGGKAFAGGVPFKLPFGTIYSTNITADRSNGIGAWSDDDFMRAMHRGVAPGAHYLYPAFPYTSFSAMSREDALAIKAFLSSLPAQSTPNRANDLYFPFNQRWAMAFWNLAFLTDRRFAGNPAQSVQLNRGAYLATALGHCGECHTPRNLGYGLATHREFAGQVLQGWQAYNITSDKRTGVGAWSDVQLAEYLSTGHAEDRGSAAGPMAEVVENSLQYLSREDVNALVAYLRAVPAQDAGTEVARASSLVSTAPDWTANPRKSEDGLGLRVFEGACAGCHLYDGQGRQLDYAALRGSESVNDPRGANLIQILLKGARYEIKGHWVFMPAFGDGYSDTELAAVANYSIEHFGAKVGGVTPSNIAKSRKD